MPPAHADPGGVDASFYAGQETEVGEGSFEGNLSRNPDGMNDLADRYHFDHGHGKGVRLTLWSMSRDVSLTSWQKSQAYPAETSPTPAANGTGHSMSLIAASPDGVDFAVVIGPSSYADYVVTVETVDIADLEIVSLQATRVEGPEDCPALDGSCGLERMRVEMVVRTIGALPYQGSLRIGVQGEGGLGFVSLADVTLLIEPGTTLTLIAEWKGVLAAGDLRIHGFTTWEQDGNAFNNQAYASYSAYVGGVQGVVVA
jgi:hypothetical protein